MLELTTLAQLLLAFLVMKTVKSVFLFLLRGGEWGHNSAICFRKSKVTVEGRTITVKIYTLLRTSYSSSAEFIVNDSCYGLYQVKLENPDRTTHYLGEIDIPNFQNKT